MRYLTRRMSPAFFMFPSYDILEMGGARMCEEPTTRRESVSLERGTIAVRKEKRDSCEAS